MKLNEFRKLSYTLYTSEDNLVKMAGATSGLKRFLRRLMNKFFSNEAKDFQEKNTELKNSLLDLFSKLKELENSIDDYDLHTYKRVLEDVRNRTTNLNNLLSRVSGDVFNVENEAKNEIKDRYYLKYPEDEPKASEPTPAQTSVAPSISDSVGPQEVAQDFVEPAISSETARLIDNLQPQSEKPAQEEPVAEMAQPSTQARPSVDLRRLPRSFKASLLAQDYSFTIEASEVSKLNKKLAKFITGDTSALGEDVKTAVLDSKIDKWRLSPKKTYFGWVAFQLSGTYLSEPVRLLGQVEVDAANHLIYIHSLSLGEGKTSRAEQNYHFRKIARDLGPNFWQRFNAMAQRLNIQPEVFLPIMYIESGFNPQVKSTAAGLVQFLPSSLKGLGYKDGVEGFAQLSGEDQLPYIEKFIKGMMSFNGGKPYTDSVTYYVSNFWPDALRYRQYYEKYKGQPGWWPEGGFHDPASGDPEAVIVEANPQFRKSPNFTIAQEAGAYKANPFLDPNKDGKTTIGDLQKRIDEARKSSTVQHLLGELKSAANYIPDVNKMDEKQRVALEEPKLMDGQSSGILSQFLQRLDLGDVPANTNWLDSITNGIAAAASQKLDMIEIYGKDKYAAAEFARVAGLVLSRDYGILPEVYASDTKLQIVYSNKLSNETVKEICNQINRQLGKNFVRFHVRKNASPTLPEMEYESSRRLVRIFRLRNA